MLLGINDLPITSLPFTPFPVPSDIPIPGTFPETQPQHPPPVSDSGKVVPDFGGAWKAAHDKAKTRITGWSLEDKVAAATGVGWEAGRVAEACGGVRVSIFSLRERGCVLMGC